MIRMHPFTARLAAVALVLFAAAACKREQAPSTAPQLGASPSALNPQQLPGVNPKPTMPLAAMPVGAGAIAWEVPKGWTETRGGGMRFATLKPPASGKVDVSVIMLPGPAGGELANVNRWRGQIGLQPVDEAARQRLRTEVESKAGTISLYDFTHEDGANQRMLAALLFVHGRSWFVKMVGDEQPVEASRAGFMSLLRTLHFPAGP